MFDVHFSRWLFLGVVFYIQFDQYSCGTVPRPSHLRVETSDSKRDSPVISGDNVEFNVIVKHEFTSKVKAVDALLKIKFPLYLKFNSYTAGKGIPPSDVDNTSGTFNFKFSEIPLHEFINLTVVVDVDRYFMLGSRETVFLSTDLDFWYYGEEGTCARPPSYYNAKHEELRWNVEFLASKACERRLHSSLGAPLQDYQYFASSVSPGHESHLASLSNPGVWLPAASYSSDRNQFLQVDFERLIKVTKIATRGMSKPFIAFVRTYHLYHSKNLIEWSGYQENHKLKMFKANTDGTRLVASYIHVPINSRFIRLVPMTWKTKQALDLEIYGCAVHPVKSLNDFCPIFDFESSLDGWSKTGTAFDNQPTIGDNLRARTSQSAAIQGQGWIATAEHRVSHYLLAGDTQGDEPIGTLTSPKFLIAASKLYFLIGGTEDSAKARAELVVDDAVVRTASGDNENLTEKEWNVEEFLGKEAVLRLVDDATDGHINFDAFRINCHLDGDADNITLPARSILLNPSTHSLYVCESTHQSHKDDSRCKMTSNNIDKWIDVPDVLGVLGVDTSSNKLYAVSNDRNVLVSLRTTGRDWKYLERSEWEEAKFIPTMLLVSDVIWETSMDGVAEETLVELYDDNGEKWNATSSGINFKGVGQSWLKIASWYCQVSDIPNDPCVSGPCEHSTKCENTSPGQYQCICLPGYTGVNCEENIDDCVNHDCLNNATCLDGLNSFSCVCRHGYSGRKCDIELPACRTFPCLNGGTCGDLGSFKFTCTCPVKYRGSNCEIVIDKCDSGPCKNGGKCIPEDNSYQCVCPDRYYGTNCQSVRHSHFTIVSTRTITSTNYYLVIKATIPSHGKSLWQNWCRDYEKLCASKDMRRPTGMGLSYNHLKHYASCQKEYNSVMDSANVLGATPNTKVAELARSVGFTDATQSNSFAFNMCSEGNCSKNLPVSGCDGALSCINQATYEVYTLCVDSNSNFKVYHTGWTTYDGHDLLILSVKPTTDYPSRHEDWCRDYQMLCKSYGLRPTTKNTGLCQNKYNAVVFRNFGVTAVRNVGNQVYYFTNHVFNLDDCSKCARNLYESRYALNYATSSHYVYNTACAGLQEVGLNVLDAKTVNYLSVGYLAIKVQVHEDTGLCKGESWCNEIQSLCESYGRKPVGCGACHVKHDAVTPDNINCPPSSSVIMQIASNAGFPDAKETNSLVLDNCDACSDSISINRDCHGKEFLCLSEDNPHRVLYTVCLDSFTAFKVLSTKSTFYASTPYLVIKTVLPNSGRHRLQNWCEDYQKLCESYGRRPTGCGASYSSNSNYYSCRDNYGSVMSHDDHLGCSNTSDVSTEIARKAGYSSASTTNTFVFHQCLSSQCSTPLIYSCSSYDTHCICHPSLGCIHSSISSSSRVAYAVCVGGSSAFEVLETKQTTFMDDDVFVVRARLPSNGVARNEDWCEDYRRLCLDYGWRPTGCGETYADKIGYVTCRSRYHSVMPVDDAYGCPPNDIVSTIANAAGFSAANSDNSFAFSDCLASCSATTSDNQFINPYASNGEVYTVCVTSDSAFKVISTSEGNFNGGQYLFIEAEVRQHKSKHAEWCTDYERMCASFGLRPVGVQGAEVSYRFASCIKQHKAVNTMYREANYEKDVRDFGYSFGYSLPRSGNTFILNDYCREACYDDLSLFDTTGAKALYYIRTDIISSYYDKVYTVCASSDSNFHVLSTRNIEYDGQNYLVVMARLPSHRESKYESWCKDYERLCRTFKMRPTGCGTSYQWSLRYRSCVEKFQSAMADKDPLGCNSSVAFLANKAGFLSALPKNSFVFHQCSTEDACPRTLTRDCAQGLACLNNQSDVVYTLCTDSASSFIVEHVTDMRDRNHPLLLVASSLPAVEEPKNKTWCVDYQKLCESFAARPTGCDAKQLQSYSRCSEKYNALSLQHDVQGCDSNGENDISRLVDVTKSLDNGRYFKFHKCGIYKCKKPISETNCHDALYCFKRSYFLYTTCSRSSSNFHVLEAKSTSYDEFDDILVIEALVPSNGTSLYDTWCHDYEKVCSVYGKLPLACPLRTDYLQESRYRCCRKDFHGYMMKNPTLPCPLNNIVAEIAQQAGFYYASAKNSFALSSCPSCSKTFNFIKNVTTDTLSLSISSCPQSAVCSNWSSSSYDFSSQIVYMLCVKPDVSSFLVEEIRRVSYEGKQFSVFRLRAPDSEISKVGDWCADYQNLCQSVSMRPIACGRGNEHVKSYRECRQKYNAVMLLGFTCSPLTTLRKVVEKAGFAFDNDRTFGMLECLKCGVDLQNSGFHYLYHTDGYLYTACSNSDSAFDVLETRNVVVGRRSFLVIKAQLPVDLRSSHESWCKDYQMMCESYGKRPLSCSDKCSKFSYNTLSIKFLQCGDAPNLKNIPNSANFSEATDENTFILHSCGISECARGIPDTGCFGGLGCINSEVLNREVYTMCIGSTTAYDVVATAPVKHNNQKYLAVRVKMPSDGTSYYNSWCQDYKELCIEHGYRPLACKNGRCVNAHGAIWQSRDACPVTSGITYIASIAGMDHLTEDTNFAYNDCFSTQCKKVVYFEDCMAKGRDPMNCYDRTLNDGEFTTLCLAAARTAFPVLDYVKVSYSQRNYLVVRTEKRNRYSENENWCKDYKELCQSFRMRPLACPEEKSPNLGYDLCRSNHLAVRMENVDHTCPLDDFVAELAQRAGFTTAHSGNSFAFKNCSAAHCTRILPQEECNEALSCLNTGSREDLYTVCAGFNTGFDVIDYDTAVTHNKMGYVIIKVVVSDKQMSLHEDWCRDYQRLCESFNAQPVSCYNPDDLNTRDFCSESYGASRQIQCGTTAHNIAVKSRFSNVKAKTALVMYKCTDCPKIITKICSDDLKCARSGVSLYAVCSKKKAVASEKRLQPLQTRSITYGQNSFLVIQTKLLHYTAKNWKQEYIDLCGFYGYLPIGCGKTASDSDRYIGDCRTQYNILSSNDFSCPPSKTIAMLARKAGFHKAGTMNSFGLYKCSAYVYSSSAIYLSTSCYVRVSCLTRYPPENILYTMCAKPPSSHALGFQVLDKRKITLYRTNFLAVKVRINNDGISSLDNWCLEYHDLCKQFNMVPMWCGTAEKENEVAYAKCKTKYSSFMPYNSVLKCESKKTSVRFVRKAGFSDANQVNTFVFNRCDKCGRVLSGTSCDSALDCLHTGVWEKIAYTLCVEHTPGFELLNYANAVHGIYELLVVEAALPKNARAIHDNWCQEYQKLCHSFGKFPVACSMDVNIQDVRKYTQRYGAVTLDNIPCSPVTTVVNIAKTVGYSQANTANTFVFAAQSENDCPQYMPASGCTSGLDCVNSKSRVVYTVCTNPTNIEVSDIRTASHLGNKFTVIKGRLPATGLSKAATWCEDYANLCRALKQQPVACQSLAAAVDYEKCSQDYDAFLLADKYNCSSSTTSLHDIALIAGFPEASFGNTFGMKACSSETCQRQIHNGAGCGPSLNCVNSKSPNRQVFALCIQDGERSNFHVQETKEIVKSNVLYLAIKALIPPLGKSKHETWCKDYQKMCQENEMRPVRCSSQQNRNCLGQFNALGADEFDCKENTQLVELVKSAGFHRSSSDNTFIYGSCESSKFCRKILDSYQCDDSLVCLKHPQSGGGREVYTICARSLATSFIYRDARASLYEGSHYLVIKAKLAAGRISRNENWCYDYRELCASFGKQPVVSGALWHINEKTKTACFTIYNGTASVISQPKRTYIAITAGFNPGSCAVFFQNCRTCLKTLEKCPFNTCSCDTLYMICM